MIRHEREAEIKTYSRKKFKFLYSQWVRLKYICNDMRFLVACYDHDEVGMGAYFTFKITSEVNTRCNDEEYRTRFFSELSWYNNKQSMLQRLKEYINIEADKAGEYTTIPNPWSQILSNMPTETKYYKASANSIEKGITTFVDETLDIFITEFKKRLNECQIHSEDRKPKEN